VVPPKDQEKMRGGGKEGRRKKSAGNRKLISILFPAKPKPVADQRKKREGKERGEKKIIARSKNHIPLQSFNPSARTLPKEGKKVLFIHHHNQPYTHH